MRTGSLSAYHEFFTTACPALTGTPVHDFTQPQLGHRAASEVLANRLPIGHVGPKVAIMANLDELTADVQPSARFRPGGGDHIQQERRVDRLPHLRERRCGPGVAGHGQGGARTAMLVAHAKGIRDQVVAQEGLDEDDPRPGAPQERRHRREIPGAVVVVVIPLGEQVTSGPLGCGIQLAAKRHAPLDAEQSDSRNVGNPAGNDGVVNDDKLGVDTSLAKEVTDAEPEHVRAVVGSHEDRDVWWAHCRAQPELWDGMQQERLVKFNVVSPRDAGKSSSL